MIMIVVMVMIILVIMIMIMMIVTIMIDMIMIEDDAMDKTDNNQDDSLQLFDYFIHLFS